MKLIEVYRKSFPVMLPLLLILLLGGCGVALFDYPPIDVNASRRQSSEIFRSADAVFVRKGDSVWAISKRHKVSMRALIEANRLKPPYVVQIGQRLVLPRGTMHTVRAGDTLYSISRRYNTDAYDLARLNNLKVPYKLYKGQKLQVSGYRKARIQKAVLKPGIRTPSVRKTVVATKTKPSKPVRSSRPAPKSISAPPPRSGKGFIWPVKGRIVSNFGAKAAGLRNDGINIAAPRGARIMSVENGVVAYAGNELRGFGNLLLIKHSGGWVSAYAHNDTILVKRGDRIKKGQFIATVGSTGNVKKPQLHFELRKGRKALNPFKYLKNKA